MRHAGFCAGILGTSSFLILHSSFFIKLKYATMLKIRRIILASLLICMMLPLSAREQTDTTYVFRFVPEQDMFYVPYRGNGEELARLETCVKQHKAAILAGGIPLHVDGYCNSAATAAVAERK